MSLNAEARRAERECLTFRRRANYETVPPLSNADKPRLQPVKVDPKVFFANERTFLAWIHMALLLGGMAIGIIGFARGRRVARAGLVLLPVAITFVMHALRQYYVRARAIRRREPGPYEDKNGPVALAVVLAVAAAGNVSSTRAPVGAAWSSLVRVGEASRLRAPAQRQAPSENRVYVSSKIVVVVARPSALLGLVVPAEVVGELRDLLVLPRDDREAVVEVPARHEAPDFGREVLLLADDEDRGDVARRNRARASLRSAALPGGAAAP
ncbi:hypothetical protein JL722_1137 [Aureococcus anophagefferens]|nr:hypothetical protein JL722_1137 [Aureococcus anophagefferens]